MEFFNRAKVVRLRSQHHKYLTASEDEETVKQSRNGSSKNTRWTVEPVEGKPNLIRLKSCSSWKYLSLSEEPFLLGWTGKRVFQSSPRLRLDPAVEWEPIKEGTHVKLRTRKSTFLRGNGGVPPWNNSVTVDVPSRRVTQDWIIWTVDVLEIDHELKDDVIEEKKGVVEESLGSNNGVDYGDLSRKSSYSSVNGSTTMEDSKDFNEVESHFVATSKSVRSVRSSNYSEVPTTTPSPRASPTASETSTRISPLVQNMRNESHHSNSFNKLKSMLNGLHDLLDEDDTQQEEADADDYTETSHHPHQLEVKMAKQTLKEMKNMNYETLLSSGRDNKLEKSINILIANARVSSQPQNLEDLVSLQDQVKSMRNDHDLAIQDLTEYDKFSSRRLEIKADLKKDASKAHELETLELGFTNMLTTARTKREALMKQLEDVENGIKAAERAQADNAVEIEDLISRIGDKSQSLREMERSEKSWQVKKVEAERKLEIVEEEWVKMKGVFQDV